MRKLILILLFFFVYYGVLFPQDSTEIYFVPETEGNYTKFKTDFINKSTRNLKKLNLEIQTSGVTFKNASVSGEALNRGGAAFLDLSQFKKVDYVLDSLFSFNEMAGTFKFELDGPDGLVQIKWTTYDDTQEELNNSVTKLLLLSGDTCESIARTASAQEEIKINAGNFTPSTGFTWEMWVMLNTGWYNQTGNGFYRMLACIDANNTPNGLGSEAYLGFGHTNRPKTDLVFYFMGDYIYWNNPLSLNVWHHIAGVCSSTSLELYVDGIRVATGLKTDPNTWPSNTGITLGAWDDYQDYYFEGYFDELRFWKKPLSAFEINSYKNECLTELPNLPSGLIAYYPVTAAEQYWPISNNNNFQSILYDFSPGVQLNSVTYNGTGTPPKSIDWNNLHAPLTCCGGTKYCLCADEFGNPNYEIISVINHPDSSDCCWRIELNVKCDMLFINRLWFNFPAVSPLSPITSPGGWNVVPTSLGGYLTDFPAGYLPQGVHTLDMCFSSPTNPTQFPVEIHLLDYYDDNNYNEPCDPLTAKLECDSICGCEDVNLTTINKVELTDSTCCHEVTIHADCDKQEIVYLEFEFENNLINSWSTGAGWTLVGTSGNSDKYESGAGHIMTGDHKFMFCFPFDMHQTTIILHYHGSNDNDACPPDTFDLACGCCDKFWSQISAIMYNTGGLVVTGDQTDSLCHGNQYQHHHYTGSFLRAGPNQISRVAMDIVKARRVTKIETSPGTIVTLDIPLHSKFGAIATNYSIGTWAGVVGSWVYGSAPTAPLGIINTPQTLLPGLFDFPKGGREVIWGGFKTTPSIDISTTSAKACYRIDYYDLKCSADNYPAGIIISDSLYYNIRYYFTDIACCTCDTLIKKGFEMKIYQNQTSSPPALVTLDNLTSGTLYLKLNPKNPKDQKIKSIVFEPLENVQILSMKDPVTGKEADIKDNVATYDLGYQILDSLYFFDLKFANPDSDYMFKNKVTVNLKALIDSLYWFDWPEEFIVPAKVPDCEEKHELTETPLQAGKKISHMNVIFTNQNIYTEPVSHILFKPMTKDFKIVSIGQMPLSSDGTANMTIYNNIVNEDTLVSLAPGGKKFKLGPILIDTCCLDYQGVVMSYNSVGPIHITITQPDGFVGPIEFQYTTLNEDGEVLSTGDLITQISGIIDYQDNDGIKLSCYPNPANTEVTFTIEANKSFDNLSIVMTNERGDVISSIVENGTISEGLNLIPFNIIGLPSGAYYYTIKTGNYSKTKLLNIIK